MVIFDKIGALDVVTNALKTLTEDGYRSLLLLYSFTHCCVHNCFDME